MRTQTEGKGPMDMSMIVFNGKSSSLVRHLHFWIPTLYPVAGGSTIPFGVFGATLGDVSLGKGWSLQIGMDPFFVLNDQHMTKCYGLQVGG